MASCLYLITGGCGFIGNHLKEELQKRRINFISLDLKEGFDLRDFKKLYEILKDKEIEGIFHLAAFVDARESLEKPRDYIENNVISTLNILEVMRRLDIDYIIFTSSAAVYGNPKYIPIDENHPLRPINPYGLSKKICEEIILHYSNLYGIKSCILRLFNVYGEGGKGVVNIWLERAKRREPLIVYGGDQTRDFIYVKDVINVMLEAFNKRITGIYNVGTGKEYKIIDIAKFIAEKFSVEIIIKERIKGEIERSVADIKKLREWYKKGFMDLYAWLNSFK